MMPRRIASSITTLSVGHVTHDRYGNGMLLGGCAAYGARALHALGARSRLVTVAGEDFACEAELSGVEVARGIAPRTTTFENFHPPAGPRRQWVDALATRVTPELLPPEWSRADVLLLAPVCGEVEIAAWLDAVRAPLVGLSLQGAIKDRVDLGEGRRGTVRPRPLGLSRADLAKLDVVFTSEEDLAQFGPDALLDELRASVAVVAVTAGSRGATIYSGAGSVRVGVHPANEVDPTGAGDTFAAAFLLSLAAGAELPEAARFASAAASLVVEGEAGTRLDRLAEASRRAERVPLLGAHGLAAAHGSQGTAGSRRTA